MYSVISLQYYQNGMPQAAILLRESRFLPIAHSAKNLPRRQKGSRLPAPSPSGGWQLAKDAVGIQGGLQRLPTFQCSRRQHPVQEFPPQLPDAVMVRE